MKDQLIRTGTALVAAAAAGTLAGGLARGLMRVATLVAGGPPEFSWGGTLGIVLVFAIAMLPGALAAAFTVRWWRWLAGAAGAVLLAVPAVAIAREDLGVVASLAQCAGVIAVTLAIFATIAAAPIATVRLVDTMLGRRPRDESKGPLLTDSVVQGTLANTGA
jgi:hypothetical protein